LGAAWKQSSQAGTTKMIDWIVHTFGHPIRSINGRADASPIDTDGR